MANVLNTGTSALLSLQRAISTTGHNIANVNTEGYSRQRVEFGTLPAQRTGGGFIGSGVQINGVSRTYDQYLTADVRDRSSSAAYSQTLADMTGRISNILADPSTGLGPALDGFFAAVQDVTNNPGSIPERQVLIGQANVLEDRFDYLNGRFQDLNREANLRIESAVEQINTFAASIAELNSQIVIANNTGTQANDLLDTRDQLITRLSEVVGVTAVEQGDGAINVFIGNGQSLVVGTASNSLITFRDDVDGSQLRVGFDTASEPADSGQFLTGGELGAVLQFRGEALDSARSQLGLIAAGLAETFNEQQALGLDLDGNFGTPFFGSPEPAISQGTNNTGTGSIAAEITDLSAVTGDRYELSFDGSAYTLRNVQTNATQTGAGPNFAVDGVSIAVSGSPAAGDAFLIVPVDRAAGLFSVEVSDPRRIAAASPVRDSTSLANVGSGQLTDLRVTDAASLPLAGNVTLTFNPDALGAGVPGFDVTGLAGGPIAFDPATDSGGIDVTLGDLSFRLEGTPAAGDSFGIANNVDGTGDNRNALALASLQDAESLIGGASFQEAYASVFTEMAVRSRQASDSATTESALLEQAIAARNGAQGVNLDEEAANLLRYQQAYQAAAQVIAVADEVFQVLLNATAR